MKMNFFCLSAPWGCRKIFYFVPYCTKKLGFLLFRKGGEIMPSAKVVETKQQIVNDLVEKFQKAQACVIVNYAGITVENDTALRKELTAAGVKYSVIKNTLIKRACEKTGYNDLTNVLEGMTAVATSETDPVAAAKILSNYAEKIETFEIKAGFVDGKVLDKDGVNELAKLPSKEILIGKVLGSLQSSLYSLAYVLQAVVDKENGTEENA
jgi:large subunit ribosomal protein L10